jgi:cytochrome c-type biogenesis protein CcmH
MVSVLRLAFCLLLAISHQLSAISLAQPRQNIPPPDLSPEVFRIAKTLRCPVCRGESAGESNSGIAQEMRKIIAEQLAAGKSEAEIQQFFVARYGDWILYSPPKRGATLWVWLSPLFGLGLLGLGLWRYQAATKQRGATLSDVSEEELAQAEAELDRAGNREPGKQGSGPREP